MPGLIPRAEELDTVAQRLLRRGKQGVARGGGHRVTNIEEAFRCVQILGFDAPRHRVEVFQQLRLRFGVERRQTPLLSKGV